MRKSDLKKVFFVGTICLLLAGPAAAQRVATVNLEILFSQYWKTGLIRAALKKKANGLDQADRQMTDDLQKARDKYQELLDDSANQALSPAQTAKYRADAQDQLEHVKELEYNITSFEQQASAALDEQTSRARKDLLADISATVAGVAKSKGYSLVLNANSSGADVDPVPSDVPPGVLYSDGADDLTQSVLSRLNAGAPVNASSVPHSNNTP